MIGFFTDPYPDESLYSSCARYNNRTRYPNHINASQELFGAKEGVAVDFPNRVDHLISILPGNHQYTSESLIYKNTSYPYIAPFLPVRRAESLFGRMRSNNGSHIQALIGMRVYNPKAPQVLRFCPLCVREDKGERPETYWRRVHQLPGVHVCPIHLVFLESTEVPFVSKQRKGKLISAANTVFEAMPRKLNSSSHFDRILKDIALNSAWLLEWRGPYCGSEMLRDRYYNLLLREEMAYYNGRIRTSKLLESFNKFYPADLLARLQCPLKENGVNWLLRLVNSGRTQIAQHPLYHVLLLIFLNCTVEDFFTQYEEYRPFGEGPWPCLNRTAPHFRQMTITKCIVTDNDKKGKRGKPRGDFHCNCGFIYTRTGPDASLEDRYRYESVIAYGSLWEKAFRKQWHDESLTLEKMAESFGLIQFTLKRHAIRLNLSHSRQSRGSRPTSQKTIDRYSNPRETFEQAREKYRRQWLSIRQSYPKASSNRLRKIGFYSYWWLRRNDGEWLEQHIPKGSKGHPEPRRYNWKEIDKTLCPVVRSVVLQIKNREGRPVRISISEVIRIVGHRGWIESNLDKLPRTARVISQHLETPEDFLIRRVAWATESYLEDGRCPTRHQLKARAGARTKTGMSPKVQAAIDKAMEMLSQKFQ